MDSSDSLVLDAQPDAVPRARRFATAVLAGSDHPDLTSDVQLVVTELVTNALLHAGRPVTLVISAGSESVRVQVRDGSRAVPVRPRINDEAMTGRGLALVGALTQQWGVEAVPGGKVVWAEIVRGGTPYEVLDDGDVDVEALLAAWGDDDDGAERTYTVHLGDVPTDLLLSAKAHVDNLVREFTLASSGAVSGASGAVPAPLARLIDTVV
ncbi:MAG: hypothetical protein QOF57_1770, partial [Frankiaceae bacterium]|nr:hypothetical protein [Frankiaceae bacterium]